MTQIHPLKKYRHDNGLTLEALAIRAGTTKATLSRIESGQFSPRMDLAGRIKAATRGAVSADDFLMPAKQQRKRAS